MKDIDLPIDRSKHVIYLSGRAFLFHVTMV